MRIGEPIKLQLKFQSFILENQLGILQMTCLNIIYSFFFLALFAYVIESLNKLATKSNYTHIKMQKMLPAARGGRVASCGGLLIDWTSGACCQLRLLNQHFAETSDNVQHGQTEWTNWEMAANEHEAGISKRERHTKLCLRRGDSIVAHTQIAVIQIRPATCHMAENKPSNFT